MIKAHLWFVIKALVGRDEMIKKHPVQRIFYRSEGVYLSKTLRWAYYYIDAHSDALTTSPHFGVPVCNRNLVVEL